MSLKIIRIHQISRVNQAMENHRKLYNLSSEEVTRIMELGNTTDVIPNVKTGTENETEKIAPRVADARSLSNMANARSTQGTKRHLSPLKPHCNENLTQADPCSLTFEEDIHMSKRRLVSCQNSINFQSNAGKTENDLRRGHEVGGNEEVREQPRTNSKMAAPTNKTNSSTYLSCSAATPVIGTNNCGE